MNISRDQNKFKHKIKISCIPAQYAELMRGRKLMTSSLLPSLEDMISVPSLVPILSLLGLRKRCPRYGEAEWVLQHGAHYMGGAREVFECSGPSFHSALGRRKEAIATRQATRVKAGKRADWNRPVTTPEMAKKAAEGLVGGLSPTQALREAGYPRTTVRNATRRINKMIRAEIWKMGRKFIRMGKELTPEEQELVVRGMLFENVVLKTDKGVAAAKQLGADRRVAMWTPDSQVGLIVLSPPAIPRIDHEVEILPPVHSEEEEVG